MMKMTYRTMNWEKHLLNAIETQGFENCNYYQTENPLKFAYDRFMSEKGWQVKREGMEKALNDWLSGLALNVAFNNHEILTLGKEWGEINETPSESREDYFLNHWFNNLTATLINLWKKEGLLA